MKGWLGTWKYILLVIGLGVSVLLIIDFNSRMSEWRRLSLEQDAVASQVSSLKETQLHLETQIAVATSPAGVREWVYQDGRWVRPGDILVVPLEAGGQVPESTPKPEPVVEMIENWQLWLSLFFDRVFP
jgi:hypothetical protein